MPSSWSTKPAGTCPRASSCRPISPSFCCRRSAQSSTRSRTSGSSCATTGSPTASSNPTTISSTIVVRHGTSSSTSLGASCPSDCANGRTSSDQWDSVLAPDEPDARRFLLKLIADKREDYYDRRDAASVLGQFNLTDDDLPAFRPLIFDADPEFIGGPRLSVGPVGKNFTRGPRSLFLEARVCRQQSVHPEAGRVRDAIVQALNLGEDTADLREPTIAFVIEKIDWPNP